MADYFYDSYQRHTIDNQVQYVIESVQRSGLCVLPGYFDQAFCTAACCAIDSLLAENNCTLWQDKLQADTRIMGIESLAPNLNIFTAPLIYQVITQLYGSTELAGFVTAGKITARPGNLGSGQGWHRDSVGDDQYKALLYLTDVDQFHGPFEYYLNTFSKRSMVAVERCFAVGKTQNRLSEQEVALLPEKRRLTLCQTKGTLVIANTRAIHRGAPILVGERYALTTYSWRDKIPPHIQKFVNSSVNCQEPKQ